MAFSENKNGGNDDMNEEWPINFKMFAVMAVGDARGKSKVKH